jgi:DNA-binding transcriptional MerR regulator
VTPQQRASAALMSIGEVLAELQEDFPDATISKIRFLETIGLVEPVRTPSNYRKFSVADVARLRYILAAQRDRYLPLKVIRAELDAMDRGLDPATVAGPPTPAPRIVAGPDGVPDAGFFAKDRSRLRLTREQLAERSGLDDATLDALESYGLVLPRPGTTHYDGDALTIATAVADLGRFGLEPRHLRGFRTAADRELGLIEQLVTPLDKQRSAASHARAAEVARELAAACLRLHAALVAAGMAR